MVRNLLIVNVGIFLIGLILKVDLSEIFGLRYIFSPEFQPYQFITHMFIHADHIHIFSNMLALYMFGPWLERVWGANRFLVFYLICGLGASILYSAVTYYEVRAFQQAAEAYLSNPTPDMFVVFINNYISEFYEPLLPKINEFSNNPHSLYLIEETTGLVQQLLEKRINTSMVGASGAVFGILMGYGLLFPNTVLMLLFPPIPVKAKYLVGFYALMEIFYGVHKVPGDNVAHFAHIGGMIFAFIIIKFWNNQRNTFY